MQVVMKILRDMAIANQGRAGFNYAAFKRLLQTEQFIKGQLMPLNMRLEVLESFFEPGSVSGTPPPKKGVTDIWDFSPGSLTIIDLSCPFVDPEDACALFNISVSLFLKKRHDAGRIIALDEAHKVSGCCSIPRRCFSPILTSILHLVYDVNFTGSS